MKMPWYDVKYDTILKEERKIRWWLEMKKSV